MDNEDLAHNEAFPLEAANDFLARWKAAGGGFYFHPQPDGAVMVQLAGQLAEDGTDPNGPARDALQTELLADPRLKGAVTTLAAQAWHRANMAAQLAGMEPEGHA